MSKKVCYLLVSQMRLLNFLLHLPRQQKRVVQITLDSLIILSCYALAMFLRLDSWGFVATVETWYVMLPVIPMTIAVFAYLGLYLAVLRYIGSQAITTVLIGVVCSAILIFMVSQAFGWFVPRSVPAIYALLATAALGGIRLFWRGIYLQATAAGKTRVAVYGAGASGRQVVASLRNGHEYEPIAFIDDEQSLHGSTISGLKVFNPKDLHTLIEINRAEVILLAMPSSTLEQRQEILARLEMFRIQVQTIPGMSDLVAGRATVSDIRAVSVDDLLGREPVPPQQELLSANISDKVVMVTGAGGSIGSELCRQILTLNPKRLVLMEQSEYALYQIDQDLQTLRSSIGQNIELVPVLASVQHCKRTEAAMRRFKVQTVYHAAAYKHVPLVEANVVEGVRNNVFGTLHAVEAAISAEVEAFIMVSTDKAVRPTNVMGATKRMGELICQAYARIQNKTKLSMVRFGNVLGSSGSVIPLFSSQIHDGGPVTVTHPEITRYFMTIPEAAQLVIQAGAMAKGGDVFVLDMGKPIRIVDLARRMISLSGQTSWSAEEKRPKEPGDIEIRFSGLRPGEKLYEELLIDVSAAPTRHPRIMTASEGSLEINELRSILQGLREASEQQDAARIRDILKSAPTGYMPQSDLTNATPSQGPDDTTRTNAKLHLVKGSS